MIVAHKIKQKLVSERFDEGDCPININTFAALFGLIGHHIRGVSEVTRLDARRLKLGHDATQALRPIAGTKRLAL